MVRKHTAEYQVGFTGSVEVVSEQGVQVDNTCPVEEEVSGHGVGQGSTVLKVMSVQGEEDCFRYIVEVIVSRQEVV
jgi:hypothetical protein